MVSFVEKLGGIDEGSIGIDAYIKCINKRKHWYKTIFQVIFSNSREVEFAIDPAGTYWENFREENTLLKSKINLAVFF